MHLRPRYSSWILTVFYNTERQLLYICGAAAVCEESHCKCILHLGVNLPRREKKKIRFVDVYFKRITSGEGGEL